MGNQPSTVSGSNVARAAKHNHYINVRPPCNLNIQPSLPVDFGRSNSVNLHPDVFDDRNNILHNFDVSKENRTPYDMDSKSEGYLSQMNTKTIFYPRFHQENRAEFSRSVELNDTKQSQVDHASLCHQHQKSHETNHRIIKVQNKQISGRNELLYPTTLNANAVGRNSRALANKIGATSKHMYEKKIILGSQQDELDTNDVDTFDVEGSQEAAKPDLSAQLSFDVDPDTLRSSSKPFQKETVTTQTSGWTMPHDIPLKNIRNFSIIAHIDHGKSTLADRLLEMTGALLTKAENKQVLDKLQVEKERGITVKAQTASLFYKYKDEDYLLNLIDTPGHVDFSNEVTRSLAACQGVILLVDANQGVQAQTVANFYLAFGKELTVVPVLNKIDLKNADPAMCKDQLLNLFSIDPEDVLLISAKSGKGVDTLLEAIIQRVPPPPGDRTKPMRALIFDSWYDKYRGAVTLIYVHDGVMKMGDDITSAHSKERYNVKGLGLLRPHEVPTDKLVGGQVGWMVCNMRSVAEAHIGDTLHHPGKTSVEPLVGFTPARPMVFAGVYPMEQAEYNDMRNAIEKLALNDPGVSLTPESSPVLGQGWRVGFLGLLHLEVFNQRLEQEYGAEAVMTAPSVPYKVKLKSKKAIAEHRGEEIIISDPSKLPDLMDIEEICEPVVLGTIITPMEYSHKIIPECIERRGIQKTSNTIDSNRTMLQFILPLNEIIVDFHDTLKAQTSGFASFDYEDHGYQASDLVKLDIKVNGKVVDALSSILHRSKADYMGRRLCEKLAKIIPRQMVEVAIQAAVGSKILARETVKAFRKDVTAKLYGGDRTRKMKLLEKQSEGKKRMKMIANINIPREAFIDYMKR